MDLIEFMFPLLWYRSNATADSWRGNVAFYAPQGGTG